MANYSKLFVFGVHFKHLLDAGDHELSLITEHCFAEHLGLVGEIEAKGICYKMRLLSKLFEIWRQQILILIFS